MERNGSRPSGKNENVIRQYFLFILSGLLLVYSIYAFKRNLNFERSVTVLKQQVNRLERINESKDQLFSIIAHDLRSAVYSLQINISNLKSLLSRLVIKDAVVVAENSEQIINATQSLLNNLLYWSLSQTGEISYRPEKIALRPLLDQVCYDFLPVAASKNILLHYGLDEVFFFTGDMNSVKIVLRNLMDNAIKYTPAYGSITVSANVQANFCYITIQDTGIGMSQEMLDTIFENDNRRVQQDASGRRSTGIGLWLVRTMAEKNGGGLSIESEKEMGTAVTITFPV